MKKTFGILLLSACMMSSTAFAQKTKKKASTPKQELILVEAFKQRTLPGRPESAPVTSTYIYVRWNGKEAPATFFWKSEDGWMSCNMSFAHKIARKKENKFVPDKDYTTQDITSRDIHKGDTLELVPVHGGKFAIPKVVDMNANNVLYYKTEKGDWKPFAIKNIKTKQDIVMP